MTTTKPLSRRSIWSSRDIIHGIFLSSSVITFLLVQLNVPDPYLDEIFHIPQTQRYCDEDFESWDPAITTPPGLYILSAVPLMTLHIPCTPALLRSTNLWCSAVIIPSLLSSILESIPGHAASSLQSQSQIQSPSPSPSPSRPQSQSRQRRRTWQHLYRHVLYPSSEALIISSFPLVYFFGNLYYTDVASLAGVLTVWTLALRGRHWLAALIGIWSMAVRQTNVIWLAFILATSILNMIREESGDTERMSEGGNGKGTMGDLYLGQVTSLRQVGNGIKGVVEMCFEKRSKVWEMCVPYMIPFGGFIAFVKWNEGIVLGHKEQHEPVFHLPQLLYFIAFISMLLLPSLFAEGIGKTIKGACSPLSTSGFGGWAVLALILIYAVHTHTTFHPFLLADNRHYVFYLLRWVFVPYPWVKYALIPVYLVATRIWEWRLRMRTTALWTIGFVACTAAVLIPSPLIEPRYFLIPTIILRVQLARSHTRPITQSPAQQSEPPWEQHPTQPQMVPDRSHLTRRPPRPVRQRVNVRTRTDDLEVSMADEKMDRMLWVEYGWYTIINILTMGLFLVRTFRWEGWAGRMRFMW